MCASIPLILTFDLSVGCYLLTVNCLLAHQVAWLGAYLLHGWLPVKKLSLIKEACKASSKNAEKERKALTKTAGKERKTLPKNTKTARSWFCKILIFRKLTLPSVVFSLNALALRGLHRQTDIFSRLSIGFLCIAARLKSQNLPHTTLQR